MKETHYIVRTPKHQLDCSKTKYFSSLKKATAFIEKEKTVIQKWYSTACWCDETDEEYQYLKSEAFRKFAEVKPIAFEVDVPEYI
jgi:hypothetical protein